MLRYVSVNNELEESGVERSPTNLRLRWIVKMSIWTAMGLGLCLGSAAADGGKMSGGLRPDGL